MSRPMTLKMSRISGSMTPKHRLRPRKRHLDVDLRELGLTVGAEVLIAEALADLHVAVDAGDHQDLLEELRRLRQREELAGMDAARHEIVARAFRRRLRQDRRFDLQKTVRVEIATNRGRDLVPQDHVARQPRPPQIEIAILQPHVFRHGRLVGDGKRRRLRLVEDRELPHEHLDFAGVELRIDRLGGPAAHGPLHADHVLGSQPLRLRHLRARRRCRRRPA